MFLGIDRVHCENKNHFHSWPSTLSFLSKDKDQCPIVWHHPKSGSCQLKKYTHNLKVESYFIWWEFLALQVWETTLRAAEKLLQGGGGRSQLLGPVLIYHLVYKLLFYSSGEKRRKTENQMRSHSSTREVLSMWSGPAGSGSWGLVRNADLPAPPLTS